MRIVAGPWLNLNNDVCSVCFITMLNIIGIIECSAKDNKKEKN